MSHRRRLYALILLPLLMLLGSILAACGEEEEAQSVRPTPTLQQGLNVGDTAPAFSLTASDGSQVSLADYAGRPVLLYFHMAVG